MSQNLRSHGQLGLGLQHRNDVSEKAETYSVPVDVKEDTLVSFYFSIPSPF